MRFSTALFHAKNAVLLVLLWVGSLWAYAHLPDTMPGHFDLMGQVSYRTETTLARWLLMPILGLLIAASLYTVAYLMQRFPQAMNVPDPDTFERLTPDRRAVVVHLVQDVMYGIAALLLLVVTVLQLTSPPAKAGSPIALSRSSNTIGIYSVAVHSATVLPVYTRVVLWVSLPLLIGLGPIMVWLVHDTTQRLYHEQT